MDSMTFNGLTATLYKIGRLGIITVGGTTTNSVNYSVHYQVPNGHEAIANFIGTDPRTLRNPMAIDANGLWFFDSITSSVSIRSTIVYITKS